MTTAIYTLKDFLDISFDGFNYSLPEEIIQTISKLSLEVGSPSYIKTPVFRKRENHLKTYSSENNEFNQIHSSLKRKKNGGNKNMEFINDEDWNSLRSFQTTKIEKKEGLDSKIDFIRSYLNKMTDKNYLEMKNNIFELLEEVIGSNSEEINRLTPIIFEIASTNRFYSKIYADFYAELIGQYECMRTIVLESFDHFLELFHLIDYVDPSEDYDKFCKINKDNEKRKALSTFFINLMVNKIISKEKILSIIHTLFSTVYEFIQLDNKKNEVDEVTENIVLLLRKDLFNETDYQRIVIDNKSISKLIELFANSKVKDYKSLTNKSIFKYMDMIDM
jgi:hypothetical protein